MHSVATSTTNTIMEPSISRRTRAHRRSSFGGSAEANPPQYQSTHFDVSSSSNNNPQMSDDFDFECAGSFFSSNKHGISNTTPAVSSWKAGNQTTAMTMNGDPNSTKRKNATKRGGTTSAVVMSRKQDLGQTGMTATTSLGGGSRAAPSQRSSAQELYPAQQHHRPQQKQQQLSAEPSAPMFPTAAVTVGGGAPSSPTRAKVTTRKVSQKDVMSGSIPPPSNYLNTTESGHNSLSSRSSHQDRDHRQNRSAVAVAAAAPTTTAKTIVTTNFEQRDPKRLVQAPLEPFHSPIKQKSRLPSSQSRKRMEGQRSGVKWIICIDTPGTHGSRLHLVRAIETYDMDLEDARNVSYSTSASKPEQEKAEDPKSRTIAKDEKARRPVGRTISTATQESAPVEATKSSTKQPLFSPNTILNSNLHDSQLCDDFRALQGSCSASDRQALERRIDAAALRMAGRTSTTTTTTTKPLSSKTMATDTNGAVSTSTGVSTSAALSIGDNTFGSDSVQAMKQKQQQHEQQQTRRGNGGGDRRSRRSESQRHLDVVTHDAAVQGGTNLLRMRSRSTDSGIQVMQQLYRVSNNNTNEHAEPRKQGEDFFGDSEIFDSQHLPLTDLQQSEIENKAQNTTQPRQRGDEDRRGKQTYPHGTKTEKGDHYNVDGDMDNSNEYDEEMEKSQLGQGKEDGDDDDDDDDDDNSSEGQGTVVEQAMEEESIDLMAVFNRHPYFLKQAQQNPPAKEDEAHFLSNLKRPMTANNNQATASGGDVIPTAPDVLTRATQGNQKSVASGEKQNPNEASRLTKVSRPSIMPVTVEDRKVCGVSATTNSTTSSNSSKDGGRRSSRELRRIGSGRKLGSRSADNADSQYGRSLTSLPEDEAVSGDDMNEWENRRAETTREEQLNTEMKSAGNARGGDTFKPKLRRPSCISSGYPSNVIPNPTIETEFVSSVGLGESRPHNNSINNQHHSLTSSSSESSSSAYTFGCGTIKPSLRVFEDSFDASKAATFMQFSLVTAGRVQVVDDGQVHSIHTRSLVESTEAFHTSVLALTSPLDMDVDDGGYEIDGNSGSESEGERNNATAIPHAPKSPGSIKRVRAAFGQVNKLIRSNSVEDLNQDASARCTTKTVRRAARRRHAVTKEDTERGKVVTMRGISTRHTTRDEADQKSNSNRGSEKRNGMFAFGNASFASVSNGKEVQLLDDEDTSEEE